MTYEITVQLYDKVKHERALFVVLQVKVDNQASLQDITSVVAIAGCYCTMEPYIDSKYDLYIQKIGNNYRTFV